MLSFFKCLIEAGKTVERNQTNNLKSPNFWEQFICHLSLKNKVQYLYEIGFFSYFVVVWVMTMEKAILIKSLTHNTIILVKWLQIMWLLAPISRV